MMVGIKVGLTQRSGGIRLKILSSIGRISCLCDKCQNVMFFDKLTVTKHICQNDFTQIMKHEFFTVCNTL
jgi:hypothetical protein